MAPAANSSAERSKSDSQLPTPRAWFVPVERSGEWPSAAPPGYPYRIRLRSRCRVRPRRSRNNRSSLRQRPAPAVGGTAGVDARVVIRRSVRYLLTSEAGSGEQQADGGSGGRGLAERANESRDRDRARKSALTRARSMAARCLSIADRRTCIHTSHSSAAPCCSGSRVSCAWVREEKGRRDAS
jgi:hypothetical protein